VYELYGTLRQEGVADIIAVYEKPQKGYVRTFGMGKVKHIIE
jgi:hypothetical protein